jgi:pimeloyl-ACP methyl ester carboxylesterase
LADHRNDLMPDYLTSPAGRRLAYHFTPGKGPGVVFLGGFKSDMTGTKAVFLEGWAKARGQGFLRLDYSGHGASSGDFEDGCIGEWAADAAAVIAAVTSGPQVLVGSSMGGWIALLLARANPATVAGLVGIAAAPDFTVDVEAEMTPAEHVAMARVGRIVQPSDYADQPYVFTRKLIEDGRASQVLNAPLHLPFPVRLLQGTADRDVLPAVALRLLDHITGDDVRLTLVKGADHRFSSPECLALIAATVEDML